MESERDEALRKLGNTAVKLKTRGMSNNEISDITGLPIEEIEAM